MGPETKTISVVVSKETYEAAKGLGVTAHKIVTTLKDGFQVGQDLPVIIGTLTGDLLPALDGIQGVSEEFKQDKANAIKALVIALAEAYGLFQEPTTPQA